MAGTSRFATITTHQSATDAFDPANSRARMNREEELNSFGKSGYALTSTVTVTSVTGDVTIIDTMQRIED